jgi:hypothetical protein
MKFLCFWLFTDEKIYAELRKISIMEKKSQLCNNTLPDLGNSVVGFSETFHPELLH